MKVPEVSVIIPVLNEARNLALLLVALDAETVSHEVIVVDGGSSDGSVDIVGGLGVRVLRGPRGRGQQLAAGAVEARGDTLLFLHADTRLPSGALSAMTRALHAHPDAPGGNFRILFDGDRRFDRWLEGFYAWIRSRGFYYGDSGIFVRHDVFRRLGGIRPIPVMEDYDLVRRLEAAGPTLCLGEPPLVSSSRRFRGRHPTAIFLGWVRIHVLFHLGVAPVRLARLYDNERRRQQRV
ncbi:MAG: TIGR04283 family arsenosugar biosynthesis glycosyltransferase [Pseudomonadota bacterium]|nr:TIGR04283 family arsenosugar biosynthesis glycosyltransferase [Pseudomonadota bacterium]